MTDVTVRVATTDDVAGVAASSAALFAEDAAQRDRLRNLDWPAVHGEQWCADLIAADHALVLVAVAEGGTCVGHLVGTYAEASEMWLGPRAELVSMYVREPYRGGGAGARLVDDFVGWATQRGAARLQVDAYAANDGVLRFYGRQGFTPHTISLVIDLPR